MGGETVKAVKRDARGRGKEGADMAENTATNDAAGSDNAARGGSNEKTFTQEQVNDLIAKRLARAKSTPPDDDEELKAKAAELDQLKEAGKTELQKATERAEKLKKELDGLKAEAKRREEVAKAAEEHGVDAELLARMSGDVAENAEFLANREGTARKYPTTRDAGEKTDSKPGDATRQTAALLFGRSRTQ